MDEIAGASCGSAMALNDSLAFNAAWTTGAPVVDRSLLESKADFYFMGQSLRFLPGFLSLAKRRQVFVRARLSAISRRSAFACNAT